MALKDPRRTKFRIGWHREPTPDGTPKWWADMGGMKVAEAVMTGRAGIDNYPWDWYLTENGRGIRAHPGKDAGVSDTLRSAKASVLFTLRPR